MCPPILGATSVVSHAGALKDNFAELLHDHIIDATLNDVKSLFTQEKSDFLKTQ